MLNQNVYLNNKCLKWKSLCLIEIVIVKIIILILNVNSKF